MPVLTIICLVFILSSLYIQTRLSKKIKFAPQKTHRKLAIVISSLLWLMSSLSAVIFYISLIRTFKSLA